MKKSLFLMAMGMLMFNIAQAQDTAPSGDNRSNLALGVKLGFNYANVYDTQGQDFVADPKLGFVAGGFLSLPLGKLFAIQPEVLFSQKGFKGSGTLLGSPYSYTRTTNYLDVPILVALRPTENLSIVAGPQFSYLMNEKNEYNGAINSQQEQAFSNDNIRKNTFCFTGGFDLTFSKLVLGARAGWDLKTNNGDGTSDTPRYKNYWYQVTLGFKL